MNTHYLRVSLIIISSVLSHHAMDAADATTPKNMHAPAKRTPTKVRKARAATLLSMRTSILDLTGEDLKRQTRSTKKQKTEHPNTIHVEPKVTQSITPTVQQMQPPKFAQRDKITSFTIQDGRLVNVSGPGSGLPRASDRLSATEEQRVTVYLAATGQTTHNIVHLKPTQPGS